MSNFNLEANKQLITLDLIQARLIIQNISVSSAHGLDKSVNFFGVLKLPGGLQSGDQLTGIDRNSV